MQTFKKFVFTLILILTAAKYAIAESDANFVISGYNQLIAGVELQIVAATLTPQQMADLPNLNSLRLRLKTVNRAAVAADFFETLAKRATTEAVLFNLSLSYVDQMQGKNLLRQGFLSTRSQSVVEQIIKRATKDGALKSVHEINNVKKCSASNAICTSSSVTWLAWYIRGINNLYWPDWFGKAIYAQEYLSQAIAVYKQQPLVERETHDFYALGYLSLGDAYALLDQPTEARRAWAEGLNFYPYVTELKQRLSWPIANLHSQVRAIRDVNQPIDTDLKFIWTPLTAPFNVTLTGGTLYGPGFLDDQPLDPGQLANLYLAGNLSGTIPAFNNGAAVPNLPGEILQGKTIDGLFSDNTPANENVDVGFVKLMHGKFNLFLAAIQDGPNAGNINFFLDNQFNWTIHDDIGIDPGFPIGVIKIYDFNFSTGPRLIPISLQTESGAPAGIDRAGSIASGAVVPGLLGDDNFDGYLDGILNAIGRFDFNSIILPGAPFAQTRVFTSNIPITSEQAALLTLANALAHLQTANHIQNQYPQQATNLRQIYRERLELARRHVQRNLLNNNLIALFDFSSPIPNVCTIFNELDKIAPNYNLWRREFKVNGLIAMTCSQ